MQYLWVLQETVIAEFDSYDEAVEELKRMPENFELNIGSKTNTIEKKYVSVVPSVVHNCPPKKNIDLNIYDHITNFIKGFYKQNV